MLRNRKRNSNSNDKTTVKENNANDGFSDKSDKEQQSRLNDEYVKQIKNQENEANLEYIKKKHIQKTFSYVCSILLVVFVCGILHMNYVLIKPHLTSLLLAVALVALLHKPFLMIVDSLNALDRMLHPYVLHIWIGILSIAFLSFIMGGIYTKTNTLITILLIVFVTVANRKTLSYIIVILLSIFFIIFPLSLFFKRCSLEIGIISNEISKEIRESNDFQTLLVKWTDSWFYKLIQKQTLALVNINIDEYVNYEQVKTYIQNLTNWVANNTNFLLQYVQGFIMNITSTFTTFGTMMSALYFGLNNFDLLSENIYDFSPLSRDDTNQIFKSIQNTIYGIFISLLLIGCIHGIITAISLYISNFEVIFLLSLLSGFFSTLPIISNWIICIPIAIIMVTRSQYISAILFTITNFATSFYFDYYVYYIIPGNSWYVTFSIITAIFVYGVKGLLIGPLIASITLTILDIYRRYQRMKVDHVVTVEKDKHI